MKFIYTFIFILLGSLLTACSKDEINKPSKLQPIKSPIKLTEHWDRSVGTGDEGLMLALRPAIVDGKAYTIDVEGVLSSVDLETGKIDWESELSDQISAGLGFDSQHLFYVTFQGELVCLDRLNGNELWRQRLTSEAVSSPVSNGKLVAVQTIDGKVFSFNVAQGVKRWRFDSVGPLLSLRGTASPILTNERTYTTFANGEMVAIDNQNGIPLWKADVGVPQGRTELERLVDVDGKSTLQAGVIYAVAYQGKLLAIDSYTGSELWSKPVSSYSGVSVEQTSAYVSNEDDVVFAFQSRNGSEIWKNDELKYRRISVPLLFNEFVVVSDFEGYIHFLDQASGAVVGRVRPDSDGVMDMQVHNDLLYIYTRSGDLLAYEIATLSSSNN